MTANCLNNAVNVLIISCLANADRNFRLSTMLMSQVYQLNCNLAFKHTEYIRYNVIITTYGEGYLLTIKSSVVLKRWLVKIPDK